MSKRILNADAKDDEEDQDLRDLLQKYIKRSEELEKRESQVMKQIETMQSAVTSLQSWNRSRKSSLVSPDPERLDLNKIDDETRQIQEETRRIQKEVEEKIEENKRLQEEVDRRRSQRSEAAASVSSGRQSRTLDPGGHSGTQRRGASGAESRPGQEDAFQEKLRKLKDVERKLKNESEVQSEKNRKRQKDMEEKLEILELESKIDKQIIDSLQKKNKDKK